jgi:isoquinoline 1-oxidoreductase beta subunit
MALSSCARPVPGPRNAQAGRRKSTGIAASDLRTRGRQVILPDGTSSPLYGTCADRRRTIEPPQDTALRDPSEWRLIGKPMQRVDIVPKSTGTPSYGIDYKVDGMVHAASYSTRADRADEQL